MSVIPKSEGRYSKNKVSLSVSLLTPSKRKYFEDVRKSLFGINPEIKILRQQESVPRLI